MSAVIVLKNELKVKLALQKDEANKHFLNADQLKAVSGEESACLAYFEGNDDTPVIIVAVDGRFNEPECGWETVFFSYTPGNKLVRPKTKEEKEKDDLSKEIKSLRKELKELREKVDGLGKRAASKKLEGKRDLSYEGFLKFCKEYKSAGAYCCTSNYSNWKNSEGECIFTYENYLESINSSKSNKGDYKSSSEVSDSASRSSPYSRIR